jgi:Coiled stalk of trimeric autotransporter adhesin
MSMDFRNDVRFNQNQALKLRLEILNAAPGSPVTGQMYYNSVSNTGFFYNGTSWIPLDVSQVANAIIPLSKLATDPLARANHTGSQLAATIVDFSTAVQAIKWNTLATPTTDINSGNQKIINLASGVASTDAVNLQQLQNALAGVLAKASARVATTGANIALTGLQTIDTVVLVANDRVLVKNQTVPSQNGLYIAASSAWVRAVDADENSEVVPGLTVFISEGATLGNTHWDLTTDAPITVGTTSLTFTQFGGGATPYTAGNGIDITSFVVSAKVNPTGNLTNSAAGLDIDISKVVRKFSANIGDGAANSITVTHNLNSRDINVQVYRNSTPWDTIFCDVERTDANNVTFKFSSPPSAAELRIVVQG